MAFSLEMVRGPVSNLFFEDEVVEVVSSEPPSPADLTAFSRVGQVVEKAYCRLQSKRIVEVVLLDDQSVRCIGSFSYTHEVASKEGWAAYLKKTDEEQQQIASTYVECETDLEDWSCGWNSIQNAIYLQLQRKVSVLDLLYLTAKKINDRLPPIIAQIRAGETTEESAGYLFSTINFLNPGEDAPSFFASSAMIDHIIFGAQASHCMQEDYPAMHRFSTDELSAQVEAIQKGEFATISGEGEAYLIYRDDEDQLKLIDPHNLRRKPDFRAELPVSEIRAVLSKPMLVARTHVFCRDFFHFHVVETGYDFSTIEPITQRHQQVTAEEVSTLLLSAKQMINDAGP
ncbi:MAG: hypothetical protein S4CHLAM102_16340 [Chlamydiia bacterium]|nr:hypothetical protein [Chlamydiia bacterium]